MIRKYLTHPTRYSSRAQMDVVDYEIDCDLTSVTLILTSHMSV